jgi:hypothetical protein
MSGHLAIEPATGADRLGKKRERQVCEGSLIGPPAVVAIIAGRAVRVYVIEI